MDDVVTNALQVIRGDEPWEVWAIFWTDPDRTAREDLTGKAVSSEIRWTWRNAGSQAVTVEAIDLPQGRIRLSLTAAQTAAMPIGRLSKLYIAVDTITRASIPVICTEGMFLL